MSAQEIDPSKVKAGDTVTLMHGWAVVEDKVTKVNDFSANGGAVGLTLAHRPDGVFWLNAWALTDHQPAPAPEWKPGTPGTATISTCETSGSTTAQHGMWFRRGDDEPLMFMTDSGSSWADHLVASFVPDDAEALRRSLEVAREGYRRYAAEWRARDERMGAEVDRLEAEVERLRAARTLPTDTEIISAMFPGMDLVRHSPSQSHLDAAARVRALFEQGGAAPTCPHGQTAEELCNRLPDDRTLTAMRLLWDSLTPASQRVWWDRAAASTEVAE